MKLSLAALALAFEAPLVVARDGRGGGGKSKSKGKSKEVVAEDSVRAFVCQWVFFIPLVIFTCLTFFASSVNVMVPF